MDKEDVTLTKEEKSVIKQQNAILSNMGGPRDDHTKWSKSDKDKYDITF